MSQALPGTHMCKEHQGNHSHYAQKNCELCQAQDKIERLSNKLVATATDLGLARADLDLRDAEIERLRERDERMDERDEQMQKRLDLANTESFYQKIEIARLRSGLARADLDLRDAQTDFRAEIERLTALIEEAYTEGWQEALNPYDAPIGVTEDWERSESRAALAGKKARVITMPSSLEGLFPDLIEDTHRGTNINLRLQLAEKDAEIERLKKSTEEAIRLLRVNDENSGEIIKVLLAALNTEAGKGGRKPSAQEVFAAFDSALALSATETWTGNQKHNSPEDRMERHKAWAKVAELRAALNTDRGEGGFGSTGV